LELVPCYFFSFTDFKYLNSLGKKIKIQIWTTNMLRNPEKSYPDSIQHYFVIIL